MSTGENEQGLRKIVDLTRLISIVLLGIHFYYYCYQAFDAWHLTTEISDKLLLNMARTGLFRQFHLSKFIALILLIISLLGVRGKKDDKIKYPKVLAYIITGLLLYFCSYYCMLINARITVTASIYMAVCITGFVIILSGGTLLSRVIRTKLSDKDIFNTENETFPQEERLLRNEFSINLPAEYRLKKKVRDSWINIINPFRGILVCGSPGSGKSYFVIRHLITQHLSKGFSMFVYDFKFDDLTVITYNHYLKNRSRFFAVPAFYVINFDDLSRSNRCNPLDKENMHDITDAAESARTILMGLNREWIKRQGDFFCRIAHQFSYRNYLVLA